MDAALIVFKNPAVAQRTSACDFSIDDLRGMRDPTDGSIKPLRVYIVVNQAETKAFEIVTALFCEVASRALLSNEPGETVASGRKLGPYPVIFVLDEYPKLAKCAAVMEGPDLGRSKKVSYVIIAQDPAQIEEKYGKAALETLKSTTAVKIILPQNNETVAKWVISMVGKTTTRRISKSHRTGITNERFNLSSTSQEGYEGVPLLTEADITSMQPGTQIALVQNFMREPLFLQSPRYYEDPETASKCWNPRTGIGYPEAAPMPEWMRLERAHEWQ
jgi:type IV secretion system protein VirD4